MKITPTQIRQAWNRGESISVCAMIKAGILVQNEVTRMLTAQMNDATLTKDEIISARIRIRKAGYQIEITGNMKRATVFELVR